LVFTFYWFATLPAHFRSTLGPYLKTYMSFPKDLRIVVRSFRMRKPG
jgi:hypothetical protein